MKWCPWQQYFTPLYRYTTTVHNYREQLHTKIRNFKDTSFLYEADIVFYLFLIVCVCLHNVYNRVRALGTHYEDLGRYSTFQYPDQDVYQYAYSEDFNADTLFHVSVSIKCICQFLHYFKQCLHKIVIIHMTIQHLLSKMW